MEINKWIEFGKQLNYKIMFILIDFEDRDHYPVYFFTEKESKRFADNIISESKCKILEVHSL